jgi:hypothetical protein
MNKHDRDNLNFLLYASSAVIADWMAKVDEDDIAYAHELLAMAAEEMNEQARALVVEAELAQMDRYALAEKVISLVK